MPRATALAPLVLVLLPAAALSSIQTESRVRRVTIHPDRAEITRTARVELPAGASRLEIAGLPAALEEACDYSGVRVGGGLQVDVDGPAAGPIRPPGMPGALTDCTRGPRLRPPVTMLQRRGVGS
jgi:hypothetical protein